MEYLEHKLMNKIKVDKTASIYWYKDGEEYRVKVMKYNREIYNKVLDRKHYLIYYNFINERVNYLLTAGILNKEYTMILLDGTIYKTLDNGFCHFMELTRSLVPVDAVDTWDIKEKRFDLILDCTLRTGEVYEETDLVYHNGTFYNNGYRLKDIHDMDRDGVEYEKVELLYGINEEQLSYLVADYRSRDFENYITDKVKLPIVRWY